VGPTVGWTWAAATTASSESFPTPRKETGHGFVGLASPVTLLRGLAYRLHEAAEGLPSGGVSALPGKAMRRYDLLRALR